jgi:hypothetical protein
LKNAIKRNLPWPVALHSYRIDHWAIFIKLSRNCGSALDQTSSDSRSTGVLRFGVFHACTIFINSGLFGRVVVWPAVLCGVSL